MLMPPSAAPLPACLRAGTPAAPPPPPFPAGRLPRQPRIEEQGPSWGPEPAQFHSHPEIARTLH